MSDVGALQVSVIEGRNIKPRKGALEFMVKVALGQQQARTDLVKGTLAPKWVKDMKLNVPSPAASLKVELFQGGSTSVGAVEIPMQGVMDARTQVQWYKVKAGDELAGEVCLVLRFVPSKEYAAKLNMSPDGPKTTTPPQRSNPTRSPSTPPVYKQISPPPNKGRGLPGGGSQGQRQQQQRRRGDVPWPLFVLGAVVAGAVGIFTRGRPKYYTVNEGDTLCTIGACYNKTYDELFDENQELIADPNVIFPGEKLKI